MVSELNVIRAAGSADAGVSGSRRPPRHWADLSIEQRTQLLREAGFPTYRQQQISQWYYEHGISDPALMTNLPGAMSDFVRQHFPVVLTPALVQHSDGGTTCKTAWKLHGGALIESVVMAYSDRTTVCVSSQAGCAMACPFCATGQGGLLRHVSTAEIVAQVVAARSAVAAGQAGPGAKRLSNVVFMGMGEPLANFPAVRAAIEQMTTPSPQGLGMSKRGITVSTVGLVPTMYRLAELAWPVRLAVSLHAPDDELRDTLVPINQRLPVAEVLAAAFHYAQSVGRRVSIEYALIGNINDQLWRARRLAEVLHDQGRGWVHVNLIPLNRTPGSKWTASEPGVQERFVQQLQRSGIPVTVRDTRGSDIDGACGQLAGSGRR